jgi:hypothetical protein
MFLNGKNITTTKCQLTEACGHPFKWSSIQCKVTMCSNAPKEKSRVCFSKIVVIIKDSLIQLRFFSLCHHSGKHVCYTWFLLALFISLGRFQWGRNVLRGQSKEMARPFIHVAYALQCKFIRRASVEFKKVRVMI